MLKTPLPSLHLLLLLDPGRPGQQQRKKGKPKKGRPEEEVEEYYFPLCLSVRSFVRGMEGFEKVGRRGERKEQKEILPLLLLSFLSSLVSCSSSSHLSVFTPSLARPYSQPHHCSHGLISPEWSQFRWAFLLPRALIAFFSPALVGGPSWPASLRLTTGYRRQKMTQ